MAKQRITRSVEWSGPTGRWTIGLTFEAIDGRIQCVGLSMEPQGRTRVPLQSAELRSLRIGELVDREMRESGAALLALLDHAPLKLATSLGTLKQYELGPLRERPKRPGRPRSVTRGDLQEVARIYLSEPRAPVQAVQQALKVSYSTASKRVSRARREGFLGTAQPGKIGGSTRRRARDDR